MIQWIVLCEGYSQEEKAHFATQATTTTKHPTQKANAQRTRIHKRKNEAFAILIKLPRP